MNEVMQNTTGWETANNTPANNDSERNSAPKKGHGYTGKGIGPGRAPGPSPDAEGRTVVQESRGMDGGHGSVGQEKGMSGPGLNTNAITRHPQEQGAAYVGDPNAKGAFARKVKFGEQ